MMKSLKNMLKQDKEKYTVPRSVHDYIPITAIWEDGIFKVGNKFAKTFRFTDINYLVAGKEDKETMFLCYSELLNSLDSGATTKLTINNRRINKVNFEKEILIPKTGDELDCYREEYNNMRKPVPTLPELRQTFAPTFLLSALNVRNWTLPKNFVCFTTFTVPERRKAFILNSRT